MTRRQRLSQTTQILRRAASSTLLIGQPCALLRFLPSYADSKAFRVPNALGFKDQLEKLRASVYPPASSLSDVPSVFNESSNEARPQTTLLVVEGVFGRKYGIFKSWRWRLPVSIGIWPPDGSNLRSADLGRLQFWTEVGNRHMGFLVRQSIVCPFHSIFQKPTMESNSG